MNVWAYYEDLKKLARQVRAENNLTLRVLPSDLRRIYDKNGIEIDIWPYRFRNLRGAFINDELGTTVMLARLPQDPMLIAIHPTQIRLSKLEPRSSPLSSCFPTETLLFRWTAWVFEKMNACREPSYV